MTTPTTNEYTSLYKYKSLTLYVRKGDVCCVWEMSGDKDGLLYWPKFFLYHSSTSFASWLGLLNRGSLRTQSPQSAAGYLRHPVSNWLKPPGHLVILFSNVHLLPLFFHLFTQVHPLIDGLVEGQYITRHQVLGEGSATVDREGGCWKILSLDTRLHYSTQAGKPSICREKISVTRSPLKSCSVTYQICNILD